MAITFYVFSTHYDLGNINYKMHYINHLTDYVQRYEVNNFIICKIEFRD